MIKRSQTTTLGVKSASYTVNELLPFDHPAQEIGSSAESTLSEASSAAADMVDRVANHGAVLDDAAAVSLVSVSV